IVRATGGLADSVQHFDPATGRGTGVMFNDYDAGGLTWAIETGLQWYADETQWPRIVANAMAQDFSWERRGGEDEEPVERMPARPRAAQRSFSSPRCSKGRLRHRARAGGRRPRTP